MKIYSGEFFVPLSDCRKSAFVGKLEEVMQGGASLHLEWPNGDSLEMSGGQDGQLTLAFQTGMLQSWRLSMDSVRMVVARLFADGSSSNCDLVKARCAAMGWPCGVDADDGGAPGGEYLRCA